MKSDFTLTVPEAAQRLGISRNGAYNAAKVGQIPTIRIGKRLLVPIAALDQRLFDNKLPSLADVGHARSRKQELVVLAELISVLEAVKSDLRLVLHGIDGKLAKARAAVKGDSK